MPAVMLHAGSLSEHPFSFKEKKQNKTHQAFVPSVDIFLIFFSEATTIGLIKVRDTYPFGVDPAWHGSRSELPFLNSLKMKMSILIGVAQMNLGIILSFFNALYFRNPVNVW